MCLVITNMEYMTREFTVRGKEFTLKCVPTRQK